METPTNWIEHKSEGAKSGEHPGQVVMWCPFKNMLLIYLVVIGRKRFAINKPFISIFTLKIRHLYIRMQ